MVGNTEEEMRTSPVPVSHSLKPSATHVYVVTVAAVVVEVTVVVVVEAVVVTTVVVAWVFSLTNLTVKPVLDETKLLHGVL